jgi:spore maturation protein CgeB
VGSFAILKEKIKGDPRISEAARGVKLSYQDYFHLLQRSKFALSLAGSGFDTLRYWEIVASKVLLISEKPFIFIPNNFEDKKHVLFCRSDCRDVPGLIKAYGRDDSAREQCIEAAYQHLLRFHTCERRAMQFLEVCHKRI